MAFAGLMSRPRIGLTDGEGKASGLPKFVTTIVGRASESIPQKAATSCCGDRVPWGVSIHRSVINQRTASPHQSAASS